MKLEKIRQKKRLRRRRRRQIKLRISWVQIFICNKLQLVPIEERSFSSLVDKGSSSGSKRACSQILTRSKILIVYVILICDRLQSNISSKTIISSISTDEWLMRSEPVPIIDQHGTNLQYKFQNTEPTPPKNRNVLFPFFLEKSPALKTAHKIRSNIRHFFVAQIC